MVKKKVESKTKKKLDQNQSQNENREGRLLQNI